MAQDINVCSSPNSEMVPEAGSSKKRPRNLNACDGCRARKVKCLSSHDDTRCQGCVFLDINCTYQRPRRKRGPPNRHAVQLVPDVEEVLVLSSEQGTSLISTPSDFSRFDHPIEARETCSSVDPGGSQLASFASEDAILNILDDWFERIHPVAPILHRRRFMRRLRAGEADSNPIFCALVVSICAATVSTLPRTDYGSINLSKCVDFIEAHNLLGGKLTRLAYSVDWCIAMYNLGVAIGACSEKSMTDMRSYFAVSEAAAGVRYLVYYSMADLDHVEQQLLKRLFWLLFAATQSTDIFGRLPVNLLSRHENPSFLRPLPVTDDQLEPGTDLELDSAWHGDSTSYIPGLNSLSDLFWIWHEVQLTQDTITISQCLGKVQNILDNLPAELRWRGGLSRPPNVTQGHDVQIANLYITSLHIRSNILQKLGPTVNTPEAHRRIVDDLLEILYHLPLAVCDANGCSLVPKIRDIGAAYMELGVSTEDLNIRNGREKLERLLRKLEDLDCWSSFTLTNSPLSGIGT